MSSKDIATLHISMTRLDRFSPLTPRRDKSRESGRNLTRSIPQLYRMNTQSEFGSDEEEQEDIPWCELHCKRHYKMACFATFIIMAIITITVLIVYFQINKSATRSKTYVTIDPDSRYPYGSAPPSYTQMASVATLPVSENIARNWKKESAVNVDQTNSTSTVTNLSSAETNSSDSIQRSTEIFLSNSSQSANATTTIAANNFTSTGSTPIQKDALNTELHNVSISPEPNIWNRSNTAILNVTGLTQDSMTFLNGSVV